MLLSAMRTAPLRRYSRLGLAYAVTRPAGVRAEPARSTEQENANGTAGHQP